MITNSITSLTTIIRGLIQDPLRTDGRQAFTYGTDNTFKISKDFISSSTIVVKINGVATEGYTYDSDTGYVTVSASLSENDIVLITYSYYKEYSDNEISGYIASSLSYFPQYNYEKIFDISNNKIITINGVNPTLKEIYFIAIIASILINPQNIHIKIPDLDISAKRDKSDQEQIEDAFLKFQNFSGIISSEDIKFYEESY